jgi:pyruvate/2-oxoglutarate dehydrogenase complex dihydrolipoamide dehydrogenase (E3) component
MSLMSSVERFENVVLGGGEAGKYIAWELARGGHRVAVVEQGLIGGSCPSVDCLPSKNVIHSGKIVELVRHPSTFRLRLGPWTLDMVGVRQHKREIVDGLIAIHKARLAANGLEFILGEGRFVAPKSIEVQLLQDTAPGRGARLSQSGYACGHPRYSRDGRRRSADPREALELDRLPTHLIVLGGDYIGLEMEQAFRRFGGSVTRDRTTRPSSSDERTRMSPRRSARSLPTTALTWSSRLRSTPSTSARGTR